MSVKMKLKMWRQFRSPAAKQGRKAHAAWAASRSAKLSAAKN